MDARDMLDVIHYFFEEDMFYSSAEQAEGRDRSRQQIYSQFYESDYAYAVASSSSNASGVITRDFDAMEELHEDEELVPFDPLQKNKEVKPFIPATPVNAKSSQPFGSTLDGPLTK